MAAKKRKGRAAPEEEREVTEYYKLHTQAVDDLIHANEENSPPVSEAELAKYRSGPKRRLPGWLKAVLIKVWFGGAVCFFFYWGLAAYVPDLLDELVVLAVALGIVTDLLVNNVFRFYAGTPGENDRWMMFPKKQFASFFTNILYAFVLVFCIFMLYNSINVALLSLTGARDTVPLGVGPIGFGCFYMSFDMLFIGMKHMMQRIFADAKRSAGGMR